MRKHYIKPSVGHCRPGITVIVSVLVLLPAVLSAQPEAYNWYFGHKAGINFATGTPVVLSNGQMSQAEGCASVSDKNGQLLFYTDGISVWNRNHQVMPNGTGLDGGFSGTQSAFIAQQPEHDSRYYVFTSSENGGTGDFSYSVVDMKLNGGLGDVLPKNVLLYTTTCEKITAARHCNRKDIWIISHKRKSNEYYAYLLTKNGVTGNPVISSAGVNLSSSTGTTIMGCLKSSPDEKKLAAAHSGIPGFIELLDFDNKTGKISNPVQLDSVNIFAAYGVEFSPNAKLLYATSARNTPTGPEEVIYQFNISLPIATDIIGSRQIILSDNLSANNLQNGWPGYFGALQAGPDKKIYFSHQLFMPFLSAINNPDNEGTACNFVKKAVNIFPGGLSLGLPNFIPSLFKRHILTTNDCQNLSVSFSIDNTDRLDSIKWDFDDPASGNANFSSLLAPVHNFTTPGIYNIRLVLYEPGACDSDTLYQVLGVGGLQVQLGNDTSICANDTLTLYTGIPGAKYEWSNGTYNPSSEITQPGTYWVTVTLAGCIASDSITVALQPTPLVNFGNDTTLCEGQNLLLNAGNTGAQYVWQDNSANPVYLVDLPGSYSVAVTANGCIAHDTIAVQYTLKPRFSIGSDTVICSAQTIMLSPDIPDQPGLIYAWQNGGTENIFAVQQPGTYSLSISNECGTNTDTVTVTQGVCKLFIPTAFSPNADGRNDIFRALFGEHVERFDLKIYNRWGQLVFHSTDLRRGWDGIFNGHLQPSGSYAWFITYTTAANSNPQYLKGTVVLAR